MVAAETVLFLIRYRHKAEGRSQCTRASINEWIGHEQNLGCQAPKHVTASHAAAEWLEGQP